MSERPVSDDAQRAFRVVIGVIVVIVVLGMAALITVVLLYRENPGRHFPFTDAGPTVASPEPSPH
jgi:hypothetical protein